MEQAQTIKTTQHISLGVFVRFVFILAGILGTAFMFLFNRSEDTSREVSQQASAISSIRSELKAANAGISDISDDVSDLNKDVKEILKIIK